MPSNVSVPANFGKDHTEESCHNNLTFILGDGSKITANSIIMSLNSPVISDMTTKDWRTSIDATDFSRDAVNCFVKASYTGRLELLTSANVADVLEMGRVSHVDWLVKKCEKFLKDKLKVSKGLLKKAPKICVPVNFGRHFIGVPTHENLTFNLGDGVKIKANSIILALNSPVIDNLTTNLHQTSLEADDFGKEAVECFIESTYTGDIETLNLDNFRDLNKMSRVFKVSWLVAKCEEYFVSYLENLNHESSYNDMMFAADEAVYLKSAMKNEKFLNLVLEKLLSFPVSKRREFIKSYLSDLGKSSVHKIDACIAMVKTDVHILVELLIVHLKRNGNTSLDMNSRHLLMNLDMTMCFFKKRDIHTQLFDALESLTEVTKEDLKLFVHLYKQNTSKACVPIVPVLQRGSFERFLKQRYNIDDIFEELTARRDVTNLYSLLDGLWLRLFNVKEKSVTFYYEFAEKIAKLARERGWSLIDRKYAELLIHHSYNQDFLHAILKCDGLVSKDSNAEFVTVFEYSRTKFVTTLLLQNNIFKFQIPGEFYAGLTFVLLTSSLDSTPDCFDLRWGLFNAPPGYNLTCLPKLHFVLVELDEEGEWKHVLPISWCGQPTSDNTNSFWNWGYVKLHHKYTGNMNKLVGHAKGYVDWKCYHKVGGNSFLQMVVFEV